MSGMGSQHPRRSLGPAGELFPQCHGVPWEIRPACDLSASRMSGYLAAALAELMPDRSLGVEHPCGGVQERQGLADSVHDAEGAGRGQGRSRRRP